MCWARENAPNGWWTDCGGSRIWASRWWAGRGNLEGELTRETVASHLLGWRARRVCTG